ncbi:hypothetical protein EMIHUDRAFT_452303 [Emiliania huxleyi CCMP1516]|uniref:Acyltransferase 3 domain-containing protein n=2 Tax=Emiliania huxleyi TaxID=2903 RepID=A0A0D3IKM9_EMIH1|nr:hypothetical protein EMIHUDRAFT_452303 [Emiliania huxleyi CCMP1516]EOD11814.1 hypothetical protein EMIHUDRAFT_452303 [Emiliania huxleyi CCMP1516]|eukprot:XP_005764243.1 hypothetical protein EMIHUDRAFT_452303 [Emiliania huxleyi CCMP1516]
MEPQSRAAITLLQPAPKAPRYKWRSFFATDAADSRDYAFDNTKGVLIFLVIATHARGMAPGGEKCAIAPIDDVLVPLLVHVVMPGFSFISGHLSAPRLSAPRTARLLTSLVVLALFNALYLLVEKFSAVAALRISDTHDLAIPDNLTSVIERMADAPLVPINLLAARQVTWFLLSLIAWPLAAATLVALAAPFTAAGSASGSSLSTVFGFWPFFVAGHLLPRARLEALRRSALVGAVEFRGVACLYGEGFSEGGLKAIAFLSTWREGQIAAYPICTLMTLGFLSLLPRRQVAGLSLAGRLSMYAYLLHPLVIFNPVVWLGQACLLRHIGCGAASTVAYLAFVVALWALLSSPLARLLCWPCVEPPVGRCCRPEAIEEGGGGAAEAEAAAGEATVAPLSPLPQAPAPPASITRQGA